MSDEHALSKEQITKIIVDNYSKNAFVSLCGIEFTDIECGKAILTMKIDSSKHTNMYSVVHGGALAALADTALGTACATTGARIVTIDYSINFLKNIKAGDTATSVATVLQRGHKVIVVEVNTYDSNDTLLTKLQGTAYIIGSFENIPEKW